MPHTNEWPHLLLIFRGDEDDHLVEHLVGFHELMHVLVVSYEDILMKLFVYSLDTDAHEWFWSLYDSTIFSLKDFHYAFHYYCKGLYSFEFLIDRCCE